jgi:Uma2 family endonuclease
MLGAAQSANVKLDDARLSNENAGVALYDGLREIIVERLAGEEFMASPITQTRQTKLYTPEEYLTFERQAEEKHEWLDGEIYAMSGASTSHCAITINVAGALYPQLRGTNCRAFSNDMKVRSSDMHPNVSMKGLFSYPDLTIVCGEPMFHDNIQDVLINPKVVIEILSRATELYDQATKFERYQLNESLTDYILIAQDRAHIEHYTRDVNNRWSVAFHDGLDAEFRIDSIDCVLKLADVYDRIVLLGNSPLAI